MKIIVVLKNKREVFLSGAHPFNQSQKAHHFCMTGKFYSIMFCNFLRLIPEGLDFSKFRATMASQKLHLVDLMKTY